MRTLSAFCLSLLLLAGAAHAKDITLAWTGSDLATGYRIYCQQGATQPEPPFPLCGDTGNTDESYTVQNLAPGRWWFAATAYNTTGESAYSSIVGEDALPGPPTLRIQAIVNIDVRVSGEGK